MFYLYVKKHNITGLKYLGKTKRNPYKYKGSGDYWLLHINKHGNDVNTEILFQSSNELEFREVCSHYSQLYNVVESNEWANIVPELGGGGDTSNSLNYLVAKDEGKFNGHIYKTEEQLKIANKKRSNSLLGHEVSIETRNKMSKTRKLKFEMGLLGTTKGQPSKLKGKKKGPPPRYTCNICHKIVGGKYNLVRWHNENCKEK